MKVAFYKAPGTIWDKLIRWWTWGPYSHTELVFSDGMWFSSSPRDGGVRFKQIIACSNSWDFVTVSTNEQIVRNWCNQQSGAYDWFGVLRFVFPFLHPSPHHWFCSEICLTALQQVGLLKGMQPSAISPNRFYKLLCNN